MKERTPMSDRTAPTDYSDYPRRIAEGIEAIAEILDHIHSKLSLIATALARREDGW